MLEAFCRYCAWDGFVDDAIETNVPGEYECPSCGDILVIQPE